VNRTLFGVTPGPVVTAWSTFVDNYQAMSKVGFRPAQLRANIRLEPGNNGTTKIRVVDKSIYIADDDANYRTEIETYLFRTTMDEQLPTQYAPEQRGARPTSCRRRSRGHRAPGRRSGA